jgi:predicted membrane protein
MVQKGLRKFSQWFLKWYDGGGENEITSKKTFLKLKCLSPLKLITYPLFEETFGAFLFLFIFLSLSPFFSSILRAFVDIWGQNHFFKNFFSNGFNILAVDTYSVVEFCMPTWLNHDYGDGGSCSLVYQNKGHAQVIATNPKKRRIYNLTMSCGSSFIDSINLTNGSNPY